MQNPKIIITENPDYMNKRSVSIMSNRNRDNNKNEVDYFFTQPIQTENALNE